MTRQKKMSRWMIIVLPALVLGYFVFDRIVLSPQQQVEFAGSATLSWTAPTENEDNTLVTDLTGYVIYCWIEAGEYTHTIYVDDPEITSFKVDNLSPGTHHCAIKAVNSDGGESALSNAVAKTVP